MSDQPTELSTLGEFGLIKKLTENFENGLDNTVFGVGDDAAVLGNGDEYTLITTDMLVEGVHFDLLYVPLIHLGYKAVVSNLSDVCAMNGTPQQITVSLAVSNKYSVEALEDLYKGIKKACEVYNVDLVGGDTTSSSAGMVISITAIGKVNKDKVVYRSGAKEGDLLLVSGDLGGAYMGLQVLEREKSVFLESPQIQPDLSGHDYILERQLKPEARVDVVRQLDQLGIVPTSMIDISDGLSSEIFHICEASGLGCNLHEDKLPMDQAMYDTAREFHLDPTVCALNGGEDYELLFTIPQDQYEQVKNLPDFSVIGHLTDAASGKMLITRSGTVVPLEAQGWNALENKEAPNTK